MKIVGILNITSDSFSDGGRYLKSEEAIQKGLDLVSQGADLVDIGAQSSNPDGSQISAGQEIERLTPVVRTLKNQGVGISVDTYKPEVMQHMISLGVDMVNDITGLRDEASIEVVASAKIPVVIMFARNQDAHANREIRDSTTVMNEVISFFTERLKILKRAGITKNIIIDPGMGLFLGGNPEPSLVVLKRLAELKQFKRPVYLSTSRKSFIGRILAMPIESRGIGTLATEIWGYLQGVDYIRTHDVRQLRQAIRMLQAIEQAE